MQNENIHFSGVLHFISRTVIVKQLLITEDPKMCWEILCLYATKEMADIIDEITKNDSGRTL